MDVSLGNGMSTLSAVLPHELQVLELGRKELELGYDLPVLLGAILQEFLVLPLDRAMLGLKTAFLVILAEDSLWE